MQFKASFFRVCAVASVAALATTALLVSLPEISISANNFDENQDPLHDSTYRVAAWIRLLHSFVALAATVGVAMRIRRRNSVAARVAILAFALWAFAVATQQTVTLFVIDDWRAADAAGDETVRAHVLASLSTYESLGDALVLLLTIAFITGNVALGTAMSRSKAMTRTVGYFFVAAAVFAAIDVLPALGGPAVPVVLQAWVAPAIQMAGYAVIGVWLWRYAMDEG